MKAAIAKKVNSLIEGDLTELAFELTHEGINYFITGFVHCAFANDYGGSDELGNVEILSRCIGCDPYLTVSYFDESETEVFVETEEIENLIRNKQLTL